MSTNKLLSVSEAAMMLGVHTNTLKRWEKEGAVSPIRIGPRKDRRYKKSDIKAILNEGRKTKKPYGTEYPYVAVATVLEYDGKVLMGKRKLTFSKGAYSLVGGYLPFGESFEEAAIHEVKEETGLTITKPKLICVTNNVYPTQGHHSITIGMYKKLKSKPELINNHEVENWNWYSYDDLPDPIMMADEKIIKCLINDDHYVV